MRILTLPKGYWAYVDDADYPNVSQYSWFAKEVRGPDGSLRKVYASSNIDGKKVYLHRYLIKPSAGTEIDHVDGNGLNNVRANLRLATRTENARNRKVRRDSKTGYKGVKTVKRCKPNSKRWQAQIKINGRKIVLGSFHTAEEAAAAYDKAAIEHFGEFALTNAQLQAKQAA